MSEKKSRILTIISIVLAVAAVAAIVVVICKKVAKKKKLNAGNDLDEDLLEIDEEDSDMDDLSATDGANA